jgi:branched-subunit amino acid aminotransferase/4-amino-4-deoxychorismate lyase
VEAVALINGERMPLAAARLAVTDDGVARGDGAFETAGVWDGSIFRLDDHLGRIAASLHAVGLPDPDLATLRTEAASLVEGVTEDAALRIYVTASGTRMLTLSPPPQRVEPRHLEPQPGPWIRPLGSFGPAGAKTMSYLPNMAATRAAQRNGADDALLVSLEGWVLEGPTFAVLWAADGQLFTPPCSLGIVDSISRRTVVELAAHAGIAVIDEPRPLDHLLSADEVMICSSVRPLLAIDRVGGQTFAAHTPIRDHLAPALDQARRAAMKRR